MAQDCRQCGLGMTVAQDPGASRCYATGKLVPPGEQLHDWQCLYYIEPVLEDGHPLTAEQHYLLKQTELEHKK